MGFRQTRRRGIQRLAHHRQQPQVHYPSAIAPVGQAHALGEGQDAVRGVKAVWSAGTGIDG